MSKRALATLRRIESARKVRRRSLEDQRDLLLKQLTHEYNAPKRNDPQVLQELDALVLVHLELRLTKI
jgi:hypothetical protein